MAVFPSKPNRHHISYKSKEAPMFLKLEKSLMEELGIATRSDLHKYALRHLAFSRRSTDFYELSK